MRPFDKFRAGSNASQINFIVLRVKSTSIQQEVKMIGSLQFVKGKGGVAMARNNLPGKDRSPHRLAEHTQRAREEGQKRREGSSQVGDPVNDAAQSE